MTSYHSKLGDDHPYRAWSKTMVDAGVKSGMKFDIAPHIKGWLEEAGFVNIREVRMPWTIGGWSDDKLW